MNTESCLKEIILVSKYLQKNMDSVESPSLYSDLLLIRNLTDKIYENQTKIMITERSK